MNESDEIVQEFLVESLENLDRLDHELVELEKSPSSKERLASIFRTMHTIKGTSGFLGFTKLEAIAHAGESLLSKMRDGTLPFSRDIADALLATVDVVRRILASVEATGAEGDEDPQPLVLRMTGLAKGSISRAPPAAVAASTPAPTTDPLGGDSLAGLEALNDGVDAAGDDKQSKGSGLADATVRVDVELLDRLMNLVGELVLARNQVLQHGVSTKDGAFVATSQRLNLITSELQEGIMKTRMQPIGNIWAKFPRIVRDLATSCGKNIRLEMDGKETELDRTIVEAIKDPLTHIVRNSADHGIETSDERQAAGKPAMATVNLRAFHEGGKVIIEIADDGRGIDLERVKHKAIERGLVTADRVERMSERELLNLIFLPGFSTAAKVTNVSGRGVGMDVVKTNIERIGGTVDLQTRRGFGTTLKIKIPLTLAIIPALLISCAGDRFAIPQVNLLELLRLEGEQVRKRLEHVHGALVYRLRGNLLPLVYLREVLGIGNADEARNSDVVNIVVLQADDRQFGLVVDDVSDTEEIVVKPLGKELKSVSCFAGATIMGDGQVALILDVLGIAQHGAVVSESRDKAISNVTERSSSAGPQGAAKRQTMLLFRLAQGERMAIPLQAVARLEEFPHSAVETVAGDEVVQYRDAILPLIRLSESLKRGPSSSAEALQVIVFAERGRSVGLVVETIEDIVEDEVNVERRHGREGLLGCAVIHGRVTELLDVQGVIRRVEPGFFIDEEVA